MQPTSPADRTPRRRSSTAFTFGGLALFFLSLAAAVPAQAKEQTITVLLDTDLDTVTGCTVATVDGPFEGVDQKLVTTVDTDSSPQSGTVTRVERQVCSGGAFGAPILVDDTGWPVGIGNGVDGSEVVETYVPFVDLGSPQRVRLAVVSADPDAMLVTQPGGDQPIVLALQSVLEIPTVSSWGLLLLGLLLALLAVRVLRRRTAVAGIVAALLLAGAGAAWAACILDGQVDDWAGTGPAAEDAESDGSPDLRAFFGKKDGDLVCFRIDAFLDFNAAPAPVDDAATVDEDSTGNSLDVLANDSDPDGDPLTITGVGTPDQGGTATTDGATITYTPAPDFFGVETFIYTIEDPSGATDSATVTVTVTEVNDDPTANDDDASVDEDSTNNSFDVLANDTDVPDTGETLTITGVGMPDQGGMAMTDGSTVTYTPAPDFFGTETFTYSVSDGNGGTDSATVTVTVNSVNDDPTAVDDAFTVDEDTSNNPLDALANDTDAPDTGETLTITGVGTPDQGGTATTDGSSISYAPAANFAGSETFTYTISDGNGGSDTATVTVTVNDANQDPPACAADVATTDEDSSTMVLVLANDSDPDPGQTATLTVLSVNTAGTTGTVTNNGTDVTYDPSGQFESLGSMDSAMDSFTYTAQDADGLTCIATVTVTVDGVNDAPTADDETVAAACNVEDVVEASAGETATPTGAVYRSIADNVLLGDGDAEGGISIVAVSGAPGGTTDTGPAPFEITTNEGGVVTLHADGSFVYTPEGGDRGIADSFTYTIQDAEGTPAVGTVTLNVGSTCVWFVDNSVNTNDGEGDGTSSNPFSSLVDETADDALADDAEDASQAGDVVYVFTGSSQSGDPYTPLYDAPYDADADESILGEGVDLVVDLGSGPETLFDSDEILADRPLVKNLAGDAFRVWDVTGVEIAGFELNAGGNGLDATSTTAPVGVVFHDNTALVSSDAVTIVGNNGISQVTVADNDLQADSSAIVAESVAGRLELALNGNTVSSSPVAIELYDSGAPLVVTDFCGNVVSGATSSTAVYADSVVFDADPSDGDFDEVSCTAPTAIGTPGDPVDATGLQLSNISGDLDIGQIDVYAGGVGSGRALELTGPSGSTFDAAAGTGLQFTASGGTVSNAHGVAVGLTDLDLDNVVFTDLSAQDTGSLNGLYVIRASGSFTVTGTTQVNLAGTHGIFVVNSAADLVFQGPVTVSSINGRGISVNDLSGDLTVLDTGSSITGASGPAIYIQAGSGDVVYNGSVTNTAGRSVEITDHEGPVGGGTITLAGAITDAGNGIFLDNNDQGTADTTINFTGGLDLDTGANTAFTATGGGVVNVVSGSVSTTADTTSGTVVNIVNTTIGGSGVTFDSTGSTGGADGINLTNAGAGAFTTLGGNLAAKTDRGVDVSGGSGDIQIDASIGTTSTGRSVEVTTHTGGTVDFNGAIDDNGLGIRLANNVGSVLRFDGGMDVDTAGGSGTEEGFEATGGGTLHVTGTNDVDTSNGTGVAVNISGGTTIGADGVTFRNVSADGAANGIVLASTGSSGAFEVTGVGTTDDSGGVIDHTTGDAVTANDVRDGLTLRNMLIGDGTATAGQAKDATNRIGGDGIDLVGVDDVVLTNLTIARTDDHGIDGTDVTNFAISDSEILNAGDDNGDSGISFEGVGNNNLDGTATVTNTVIDGAVEFGMRVQNSSGTLGLTVTGSQFSNTANTDGLMFGEDGLQIEVLGSAQTTALIHGNSTFSKLESDGVMGTTSENGGAVLNVTIDGNTFTGFDDGAPNMRSDNAIELNATGGTSSANSPDLRYTINGNTINASSNSAILVGANDFTDVDGRITGNTVDGSLFGYGIEATLSADDNSTARMLVTGNTLSNYNQPGAFFNANNSGDLDITFNDNMVTTQPTDATAFENVTFQVTSGSLCAEASGNTVAAGGANAFGPGVPADAIAMIRSGGTAQLEVGSANLADPASTVLTTNNPAASSVFTSGTITVVSNGTCASPIATPQP